MDDFLLPVISNYSPGGRKKWEWRKFQGVVHFLLIVLSSTAILVSLFYGVAAEREIPLIFCCL
jgi:hypothetical protein